MKRMLVFGLAVVAVGCLAAACSGSGGSGDDVAATEDSTATEDAPAIDVAPPEDVTPPEDTAVTPDVPPVEDVAVTPDVPAVEDVAVIPDVPPVEDVPSGPAGHTESNGGVMHKPGKADALSNCTGCHGDTLQGGMGPSCYTCHNNNDHTKNKDGFKHMSGSSSTCSACHGPNNSGGLGPACSTCH